METLETVAVGTEMPTGPRFVAAGSGEIGARIHSVDRANTPRTDRGMVRCSAHVALDLAGKSVWTSNLKVCSA
jgi:hypothetical protein